MWSQPSPGWEMGSESRKKAQSIGNRKVHGNTHGFELPEKVHYLLHQVDLLKDRERRLCHLQINLCYKSKTSDVQEPWGGLRESLLLGTGLFQGTPPNPPPLSFVGLFMSSVKNSLVVVKVINWDLKLQFWGMRFKK